MTLLAPDIQERILFSESVDAVEPMSESALREGVRLEDWAKQPAAPSLYRGQLLLTAAARVLGWPT